MGYSVEAVIRARARLAEMKDRRDAENREHLNVAYEKIPRIREIDRQLKITMAEAAYRTFSSGVSFQEEMEQVKEKNLALQRERAQLVGENFPAGYLDEEPVCNICGGSGYVGSRMCSCLEELCRQEQIREISSHGNGKSSFEDFSLEYYPVKADEKLGVSPRGVMERTFRRCKSYAEDFGPGAGNLLLTGGTGLGKTLLSTCIAQKVAERGCSVRYESAAHLFEKLQKAKFTSDEEAVREADRLANCDLLIIDDLGTEYTSAAAVSLLYTLLNDRILANKPMVISTNLSVDEMSRRYSPQIASRLHGCFSLLPFLGDDVRVLKEKKK